MCLFITAHTAFADSFFSTHDSTSAIDKEPEFVKFVQAIYPEVLLHKGVEGIVDLGLLVNETGHVDSVWVIKGVSPFFDSAAKTAAIQFIFTPAEIQSRPVPTAIQFQYIFSLNQVLDSIKVIENFTGIVRNKQTNRPLPQAILTVVFTDSICKQEPFVPIAKYLNKIGTFPGQYILNSRLFTTTDSSGKFSFKSLPCCTAVISIFHPEYQTLYDTVVISGNKKSDRAYQLKQITFNSNEIVVIGELPRKKLLVENEEKKIGRTDDFNNIITQKLGVASIPNASSRLLVNGEGPYDNGFLLRGIPIFTPSHFSGVPYFDRSIFSLGTPLDIELLTTGISGLYSGSSGALLQVDPGILHSLKYIPRPELLINYGTLGADITFTVPGRKGKDWYQISYRPSNKYALWFLNEYKTTGNNVPGNFASPSTYTDLQFLGEQHLNGVRIRELFWFSNDTYLDSSLFTKEGTDLNQISDKYEKSVPWGICVISLDSLHSSWLKRLDWGGAMQHWFESRAGIASYSKDIERKVIALSADGPSFLRGSNSLTTHFLLQHIPWAGRLEMPQIISSTYSADSDSVIVSGIQNEVQISESYYHTGTNYAYGINLCEGLCFPGTCAFIDPGFWLRFPFEKKMLRLSLGIITSPPDIRGMPSGLMENKVIKTYNTSALMSMQPTQMIKGSLESFIKYKPFQPVINQNPRIQMWDSNDSSKFFSYGLNLDLEFNLCKKLSMRTMQSFSKSKVFTKQYNAPYEWDIPWTNKTIISYSFIDNCLSAFLISNLYAGTPYHDIIVSDGVLQWDETTKRNSQYSRIDFKFQICQPVTNERNLLQYDIYILLSDLTGFFSQQDERTDNRFNWLYHVHAGLRTRMRF
jgi:hypothetical protein